MECEPATKNGHYYELDSLRGLAALTVMFHHFVMILPAFALPFTANIPLAIRLIHFTPLGYMVAGRAAVIFFFVLSGFVLSLPFLNSVKKPSAPAFIIKRICRIYPAYLLALLFAVTMNLLCYRGGVAELSNWFNSFWWQEVNWHEVANQLFLVNSFDAQKYNPPIWSLVIEMRLSLVFPLLVFFATRFGWKANIIIGIACSLVGWGAQFLRHRGVLHFESNYIDTLNYVFMFVVGIQLAFHRDKLRLRFLQLSRPAKHLAFFLALLAYTNDCWMGQLFRSAGLQKYLQTQFTIDVLTTVAVSGFIVMALASGKISSVLLWQPFQYLGKISYSFYLLHIIILFALFRLLNASLPLPLVLVLVAVLSFVFASLSYHWVEIPFIRLGKFLSQKLNKSILPSIPIF